MKKLSFLFLGIIILVFSCKPFEGDPVQDDVTAEANELLYKIMQEYYLWYDEIPAGVDPESYSGPVELLNAMRADQDPWSYVADKSAFEMFFERGMYYGYGFNPVFDASGVCYVGSVYKESDVYTEGVRRTWLINKIDNQVPTPDLIKEKFNPTFTRSIELELLSPDGVSYTKTFNKKLMSVNSVLHKEVIEKGAEKIGYLVYNTFLEPTLEELDTTFGSFQAEGITELILDLRYNGGGQVNVAHHLANLIVGATHSTDTLVKFKHNDKHPEMDSTYQLKEIDRSFGLEKLVVITSSATASASELLINGLDPIIDVTLIGSDTYGKPVGMYGFDQDPHGDLENFTTYMFVPICFEGVNGLGEGGFYDGIPVDYAVNDDLTKDWGDQEEACLAAAIQYISSGSVTVKKSYVEIPQIRKKGLQAEIGAY